MPKPRQTSQVTVVAGITLRETIIAIIALLEREQQLLAQPQADALETIAGQKQALLNRIQTDAPGRGAQSVQSALKDPALRALAARAQQLNAANARLLALHRTACESRLHLLRGGSSANALYRANGYLGV